MITLEKLQLKNFLSHSDTELNFKNPCRLLVDGISGSGKSSICDAITFALYGKARADNRALIKRGEKKGGVQLMLKDGEKRYLIRRQLSSTGKQTLEVGVAEGEENYKAIEVSGLKNTQEHIEKEILHSSYLLFVNSAATLQENNDSFIKQTAEKRKDIILEIIRASDYDQYYERAKEFIKDKDLSLMALEIEKREKEAYISIDREAIQRKDQIEAALSSATSSLEACSAELARSKKRDETRTRIADWDATSKLLWEEMERIKQDIVKIDERISAMEIVDIIKLEEQVNQLPERELKLANVNAAFEQRYVWNVKRDLLEEEIGNLNKQLVDVLGTEEKKCPNTNQPCAYLNKFRQEEIERLTARLERKKQTIVDLGPIPEASKTEQDELVQEISVLRKMKTELAVARNTAQEMDRMMSDKKQALRRIEEIDKTLLEIAQKREEICAWLEINAGSETTEQLEQKYRKLLIDFTNLEQEKKNIIATEKRYNENMERIAEIAKVMYAINEEKDAVLLAKEAFGNQGIKSLMVDYVLPKLEDKINEVLHKMSDFTVRIETQKSGYEEGSLLEGLFLTITDGQGQQFDYSAYSGGEKLKTSSAITEGLASLQNIGFRILDESVVGLDNATINGYMDILDSVQSRFNQLICISHLQNVKDAFPEKVTVVKQNGNSLIKNI